MNEQKVVAIAVVHGNRWNMLEKVLEASLKDPRVINFIIVDNLCFDKQKMDTYSSKFADRIIILRQEKNIGYSGAIAKGLARSREINCDYVFLLDDDSVPEDGFLDFFINNLKLFKDKKVILSANRINISAYDTFFHTQPKINTLVSGSNFEVFSFKKIINFLKIFNILQTKIKLGDFIPILPTKSFVTGGSFIPVEAVRQAPLPDENLFMYGEDIEYSWGIKRLGYKSYACYRPILIDLDLTFGNKPNSHIVDLFNKTTPEYKVYLRLRNAVIISKRNTTQNSFVFLLNVIFWTIGLLIVGLFKSKSLSTYLGRVKLIYRATVNGYKSITKIPENIKTP